MSIQVETVSVCLLGMSKGDILRLNRMYNCPHIDPQTAQKLEDSLPEVADENDDE